MAEFFLVTIGRLMLPWESRQILYSLNSEMDKMHFVIDK